MNQDAKLTDKSKMGDIKKKLVVAFALNATVILGVIFSVIVVSISSCTFNFPARKPAAAAPPPAAEKSQPKADPAESEGYEEGVRIGMEKGEEVAGTWKNAHDKIAEKNVGLASENQSLRQKLENCQEASIYWEQEYEICSDKKH